MLPFCGSSVTHGAAQKGHHRMIVVGKAEDQWQRLRIGGNDDHVGSVGPVLHVVDDFLMPVRCHPVVRAGCERNHALAEYRLTATTKGSVVRPAKAGAFCGS